jgi:threonine/homoserine efflux transporter RhtA
MSPPTLVSRPLGGRLRGAGSGVMMAVGSMSCVQLGLALSAHLLGQLGPLGITGLRLAWAGLGIALGAGACWGTYILLTQHVGDRVTGLSGLAVSIPVAGIVALLAAGSPGLHAVTWPLLAAMLALAALHPVLPFSLEFLALRRLTASAFGTLMSLEPAFALLAGLLVLGQVPSAAAAVGILFVVIAGIGATRTGARTPQPHDHRDAPRGMACWEAGCGYPGGC